MNMTIQNDVRVLARRAIGASALLCTVAGAQSLGDVRPSPEPLVLKQQGSFFVGGRQMFSDAAGWDLIGLLGQFSSGDVTVDQMYVQFQIPQQHRRHVPIVFVHGCCLSSKTWETTPDGRMGWYEYFTRQGFDTYMADQVGRARSGFDALQYQKLRYDSTTAPFTAVDGSDGVGCVNTAATPNPNPAG